MKYRKVALTVLLLLTVLVMMLPPAVVVSADPSWYDASWLYRKAITITGASTAQTDYQVKVPVSFISGHMNADFSDIRFTGSDGTTLLNHWQESFTASTSAVYWVKVPSIPTAGTTIYMYYGKPTATSASNGENTFVFFDDFSTDKLSQYSNIRIYGSTERSKSLEGGKLKDADVGSGDNQYFFTKNNSQLNNLAVDIKLIDILPKDVSGWQHAFALFTASQSDENNTVYFGYYRYMNDGVSSSLSLWKKVASGPWTELNRDSSLDGTGKTLTLAKAGNDFKVFIDGTQKWAFTDATLGSCSMFSGIRTGAQNGSASASYWDDFRIRKYASPEPAAAVGAENAFIPAGQRTIEFDCGIDTTGFGPWLYDAFDDSPYVHNLNPDQGVYAYASIVWNPDGRGDSTCGSTGSGHQSYGNCTAENTNVQNGTAGVTLEFSNFSLAGLQKINWGQEGHSFDRRNYTGGSGTIKVNGIPKLKVINSRITMDVQWTASAGNNSGITGSGWGTIDPASDDAWEAEFNNGNGQVEFEFGSFSPVIQPCWGFFASHLTVKGAPHVENLQILPVNAAGAVNFPDAKVSLDVVTFTKGGPAQDQNNFMAKRILANPGGEPPARINQIIPYCYWELATVLDAIKTSVTFDLTGVAGITDPNLLCVLKREDATKPWEIYTDYTLVDATHIMANNVTSFSEWGLGLATGTPVHNTTTNQNFVTIQAALNDIDTQNGNTIKIDAGTLKENVNITKQVTIESTSGNNSNTIIVAANANDHVFEVMADYVTIRNLTIYGATGEGELGTLSDNKAGIFLGQTIDHCNIVNNLCGYYPGTNKNDIGIYLSGATDNTITNNTCSSNNHSGIYLMYASTKNNTLSGNNCNYNGTHGIYLYTASENTITDNICSHNTNHGIFLDSQANRNNITGNTCDSNTEYGIYLLNDSGYNNVSTNAFGANLKGVYLEGSSNNTINNNCIGGNSAVGIQFVSSSQYNTFIDNDITASGSYGIYPYSSNNTLYLNTFSNPTNVFPGIGTNTNFWSSPTKIHYKYNGTAFFNYLGNYYSNYSAADTDNDGIGNTAYDTTDNTDDDLYPMKDNPSETPAKYTYSNVWYLGNPKMYLNDLDKPPKAITIPAGGSITWATDPVLIHTYPENTNYAVKLTFTSPPGNGTGFTLGVGYTTNGTDFDLAAAGTPFSGDGSKKVFSINFTGADFGLPARWLAINITNGSPNPYTLQTGGGWSYFSAPAPAGAASTGSVSGVVYNDANGNGIKDTGETGISGVTIKLKQDATEKAVTTTIADGTYTITNVATGDYTVEETDPNGYTSTTSNTVNVTVNTGATAMAIFGDREAETISTPTTPTGPDTGVAGNVLTYLTGGAASNLVGHNVEYRFAWGDGIIYEWLPDTSVNHIYNSAGTYEIKAQARCVTDTAIVSAWSTAKSVVISAPAYAGPTWYTSPTTGNDTTGDGSETKPFRTIGKAITQASNGDTIKVMDDDIEGTDDYVENITVDKSLTIERYNDTEANPQVKALDPNNHVFNITVSNVTIRGLDIYGSTGAYKTGIRLGVDTDHCTIENNRVGWDSSHKNSNGIFLNSSSNNTISGNTANFNQFGIYLYSSSNNNTIIHSTCTSNANSGICLEASSNNTLADNYASNNGVYGIHLRAQSNYNTLVSNRCPGYTIPHSNIGFALNDSHNNNMWWNSAGDGLKGLALSNHSDDNTVVGNFFAGNEYGLTLSDNSSNNTIYFNSLTADNVVILSSTNSTNIWQSPTKLAYKYNNQTFKGFMGNYYGNYGGSDSGSGGKVAGDGIGDTSYATDGTGDNYPLMQDIGSYEQQTWYLSNPTMYKDGISWSGGTVALNASSSVIWKADAPVASETVFSPGVMAEGTSWTGQVVFTEAPASLSTFTVQLGYSTDGTDFTAGGAQAALTGDNAKTVFTYATTASAVTIPVNKYLALKINNNSAANYSIRIGGSWSYVSASFEPVPTTGTVSGVVFNDLNGNGTKDTGETGIGGVNIYLHFILTQKGETTTAADGTYTFSGVIPGYGYTVTEASDPAGYASTTPNQVTVDVFAGGTATANFGDRAQHTGSNWYVSPNGSDTTGNGNEASPFATIQKAVDTASDTHIIIVKDGTYIENVNVNKTLTIQSQNGYNVTTVEALSANDHVFEVTANNVTIKGFTVYGTGVTSEKAGIELHDVSHCVIENNRCGKGSSTDNDIGIHLYRGSYHTILNNRCIDNNDGIYLESSDNNIIDGNIMQYSEHNDIKLDYDYASYPNGSDSNIIRFNQCSDGVHRGIYLNLSTLNEIYGNTITYELTSGIELYNSSNNTIHNNTISHNTTGIQIGAAGYPSNGNIIYLNDFESNFTANVTSAGSINSWKSPQQITYDYTGGSVHTSYLGNYYSNATGTDPDGDGIRNTPYDLPGSEPDDSYPLMATSSHYTPLVAGDANGDGVVDAVDITKVERVIAGLDVPTPGADANQDSHINALDITKVEMIIAELGM